MEFCDIVNQTGQRTGKVVPRGSQLEPGEFFPVVHIWIRDTAGRYLIQQRALHLAAWPGQWAATVGYVQAGEDSRSAAIREAREEVGIALAPDQLIRWKQMVYENLYEEVWLTGVTPEQASGLSPGPDVAACLWATKAELAERIRAGAFYAYSYFPELPE